MKKADIDQQVSSEPLDYIDSIISKIPAKSDKIIALSIMLQIKSKELNESIEGLCKLSQ